MSTSEGFILSAFYVIIVCCGSFHFEKPFILNHLRRWSHGIMMGRCKSVSYCSVDRLQQFPPNKQVTTCHLLVSLHIQIYMIYILSSSKASVPAKIGRLHLLQLIVKLRSILYTIEQLAKRCKNGLFIARNLFKTAQRVLLAQVRSALFSWSWPHFHLIMK